MKIIGTSGVSIFLAAQVMRKYNPTICLKDGELVNHHSAVLRFKSTAISDFLNIRFKKVTVDKCIKFKGDIFNESNIKFQNMYSEKVTGSVLNRSIRNLNSEVRYIAPDNLFKLISHGFNIKYNCDLIDEIKNNDDEPILSYLKLPDIVKSLYDVDIDYSFNPVYTLNCTIDNPFINVYQTIYYPGYEDYYRATLTGNKIILEFIEKPDTLDYKDIITHILVDDFGLDKYSLKISGIAYNELPIGKMNPIDDSIRKSYIHKLTLDHNIYSFGRNGIWKSIRLDELFSDLMKIDQYISSDNYKLLF